MKTQSTQEAMAVLEATRGALIEKGREIAIELCQKNATAHIREVRAEMERRGLLDGKPEFWLGKVFCDKRFEWTDEYHSYSDPERNIHERTVKIWKLAS